MVVILQLLQFPLIFIYFVTAAECLDQQSLPLQEREENVRQNNVSLLLLKYINSRRKNNFKFMLGKGRWTPLYKSKLGTKENMHIPPPIRRGTKIRFRFLKPFTDLIDSMEKLILFFHQNGKSKNFKKKNLHIRPYLGKKFPVVATMKKTNNNKRDIIGLILKKDENRDDGYAYQQPWMPVDNRRDRPPMMYRYLSKVQGKTTIRGPLQHHTNKFKDQRQKKLPQESRETPSRELGLQADRLAELFYFGNWLSAQVENVKKKRERMNRKLDVMETKRNNSRTEMREQPKEKEYLPFQRRYGREKKKINK